MTNILCLATWLIGETHSLALYAIIRHRDGRILVNIFKINLSLHTERSSLTFRPSCRKLSPLICVEELPRGKRRKVSNPERWRSFRKQVAIITRGFGWRFLCLKATGWEISGPTILLFSAGILLTWNSTLFRQALLNVYLWHTGEWDYSSAQTALSFYISHLILYTK